MIFRTLVIGIAVTAMGGVVIRGMEKLGRFGVIFMPAVELGIGSAVHAALGRSSVWSIALAGVLTYTAAMSTHIPSAYGMFRREFGGTVVRSLVLSVMASLRYPLSVSSQFGFYCLMLILSIVGAGCGAGAR
jgi:hypothetical protein